VWISRRGGDFFWCLRAVENFVRVLAPVPKFVFLVAVGYVSQSKK
jgi:hypothetical protein